MTEYLTSTENTQPIPPTQEDGEEGSTAESLSALDKFPGVLNKISLMWGTRELDKFIHKLIMDSRDGTRQGFPMAAAEELLFLSECNKIIRAIDAAAKLNITLKEAYRMIDSGDQAHMTSASPWGDPSVTKDAAYNQDSPRYKSSASTSASTVPSNASPIKKSPLFWIIAGLVALIIARIAMTVMA